MRTTILSILLLLMLAGCEQPAEEDAAPAQEPVQTRAQDPALAQWYQERARKQRQTLEIRARTFRDAVSGLLTEPGEARLNTARETWRGLHEGFHQAFVPLRITVRHHPRLKKRLTRVDPTPIFPGYIDGLSRWPDSGIVHDRTVELSRASLLEQQGATAEGEASVGFQVVHFLLHGEPQQPRTPEAFRVLGKVPEHRVVPPEWLPEQRRRDYLRVVSNLLTRDLEALARTTTPAPTATALLDTLRALVQRLIRLEGLTGSDDVAGEYMAPAARTQAVEVLFATLQGWLAADTPLMTMLDQRSPDASALRERLSAIEGPDDVEALQALHAELATLNDRLGQSAKNTR
jgi:hypothetical protein